MLCKSSGRPNWVQTPESACYSLQTTVPFLPADIANVSKQCNKDVQPTSKAVQYITVVFKIDELLLTIPQYNSSHRPTAVRHVAAAR